MAAPEIPKLVADVVRRTGAPPRVRVELHVPDVQDPAIVGALSEATEALGVVGEAFLRAVRPGAPPGTYRLVVEAL